MRALLLSLLLVRPAFSTLVEEKAPSGAWPQAVASLAEPISAKIAVVPVAGVGAGTKLAAPAAVVPVTAGAQTAQPVALPAPAEGLAAEAAPETAQTIADTVGIPKTAPASLIGNLVKSIPAAGEVDFDHTRAHAGEEPAAVEMLRRLSASGLSSQAVAKALVDSSDLPQARQALVGLGLLGKAEWTRPEENQRFFHALSALWTEVAPAPTNIDSSWAIPALTVKNGDTTYFLHGISHRMFGIPVAVWKGQVRQLVSALKTQSLPLYSEEILPRHLGYSYGAEILDQRVKQGLPAGLRRLPSNALHDFARRAATAAAWAGLASTLAYSAFHAGPLWALAAAAAGLAVAWLYATAFKPFYRLYYKGLAEQERRKGDADGARYNEKLGEALYGAQPQLAPFLKTELPMPLVLEGDGSPMAFQRSVEMGRVAAADARATGQRQVHLIVGINHALHLSWLLSEGWAQGPTPKAQTAALNGRLDFPQ